MHLGMPECHKPFLGHCDLDLWPSFQELLCPEHISYIIWCRNPKFGVVIPLGMAEWCIQFWVILTLTLTSGFISNFSCYIIAIFPQMCLVLDQFLWGHSSRVCDISCFVLNLFYSLQRGSNGFITEGVQHFPGGGSNFFQGVGGVQRNPYNLWFSRGGVPIPYSPSGSDMGSPDATVCLQNHDLSKDK